MTRTATVDVVTGQLTIDNPAEIDGITTDATTVEPWGAEEYGMERADEALTDLGYVRDGDWRRSDTPDSEWTCTVRVRTGRPPLDPAGSSRVTVTIPNADIARLDDRAAQIGIVRAELVRRYVTAGLAQEPGAPVDTFQVMRSFAQGGNSFSITGPSLIAAIEENFKTILRAAAGIYQYRLVEAVVRPGRGTVGGKSHAELHVTYAANTGLQEHDERPPRKVTITILGSLDTLPEPHVFEINA